MRQRTPRRRARQGRAESERIASGAAADEAADESRVDSGVAAAVAEVLVLAERGDGMLVVAAQGRSVEGCAEADGEAT